MGVSNCDFQIGNEYHNIHTEDNAHGGLDAFHAKRLRDRINKEQAAHAHEAGWTDVK